jgi:hypothetical protein
MFFLFLYLVCCYSCFVILCIFIFVCTSVGLLPPGESPTPVNNNDINNNNIDTGYCLVIMQKASRAVVRGSIFTMTGAQTHALLSFRIVFFFFSFFNFFLTVGEWSL